MFRPTLINVCNEISNFDFHEVCPGILNVEQTRKIDEREMFENVINGISGSGII